VAWRVWGTWISTADVAGSSPVLSMPFTPTKDTVLHVIRTWVTWTGAPVVSNLQMRVYADRSGSPSALLWTSQPLPRASFVDNMHGAKEVPLVFSPKPWLKQGVKYHLALWPNGYTGTESSHLAWMRAFPDPAYTSGMSVNGAKLATLPFAVAFIGGRP
jgi:hypothetical protein